MRLLITTITRYYYCIGRCRCKADIVIHFSCQNNNSATPLVPPSGEMIDRTAL